MDPDTVDSAKIFSVAGMVVVITGGGTGLGLMMTRAFASNGAAKVYIVGRRQEKLEAAAREAGVQGNVVPLVGDVTSKESLVEVAERVRADAGFVNLLICNSGIYPTPVAKSGDVSIQEFARAGLEQGMAPWNDCFATNTTAVAFTAYAFLELLDAGNKARNCAGRQSQILVTSSIAGYLRNLNTVGAYPISKAATTHLVKCLAGVLATYSIRVNALAPGLFPSDLAAGLIASRGQPKGGNPSVEGGWDKHDIPAERLGSTADMAGTVLYLASAAGAYVNGSIQLIDGGRVSQMPATY